jgi:outer membrane lipoprotein carrier protein
LCRFAAIVVALVVAPAYAGGTDRLNAFMTNTQSARSEFTQRIVDKAGKLVQESSGTLEFARPGKFRWSYVKPYAQTIVGDGAKIWIHDPDLNQVTVRKLDAALGATPAALLAGNNDAMKAFDLKDDGEKDGLQWVIAAPRSKETSFDRIRMGFSAQGIEAMELVDAFGQRTVLRFSGMQRNPRLDPGLFQFTPPKGADVIGE